MANASYFFNSKGRSCLCFDHGKSLETEILFTIENNSKIDEHLK